MTADNLPIEIPEKIVIIGVGNLLLKDEGIGVHVVQTLQGKNNLPENVEIVDAGTAALDVLQMLGQVDRLIVIDAVKGGCEPGTIYKFKPGDICSTNRKPKVVPPLVKGDRGDDSVNEVNRATTSLHQLGFIEALNIVEKLGSAPKDVTIIGIEPKEIEMGLELSAEIAGKIPKIVQLIQEMIG